MPKINLLPWRAELRTRRRNQFFIGLGASVGAAGLAVLASNFVMNGIIASQNSRNEILKTEISALDKRSNWQMCTIRIVWGGAVVRLNHVVRAALKNVATYVVIQGILVRVAAVVFQMVR